MAGQQSYLQRFHSFYTQKPIRTQNPTPTPPTSLALSV